MKMWGNIYYIIYKEEGCHDAADVVEPIDKPWKWRP